MLVVHSSFESVASVPLKGRFAREDQDHSKNLVETKFFWKTLLIPSKTQSPVHPEVPSEASSGKHLSFFRRILRKAILEASFESALHQKPFGNPRDPCLPRHHNFGRKLQEYPSKGPYCKTIAGSTSAYCEPFLKHLSGGPFGSNFWKTPSKAFLHNPTLIL